eukprot:5011926-Prymnesium_polylepis.2
MVAEGALVLTYFAALLIKSCDIAPNVCPNYGFGETADGERRSFAHVHSRPSYRRTVTRQASPNIHPVAAPASGIYIFFIFFALALLMLLLVTTVVRLYYAGYVPKIFLGKAAHTLGL